jgi:methionyl-tRNA synthetase
MDQEARFFITTAIDYPNSRPHIGTAFEKIGADVQARFRRMEGDTVHFLMGNDENTIKVPLRARELGVEPKAYVDQMAREFQDVWRALDISYDDFIQTSEERHHAGCRFFIQKVFDAGDIYKSTYKGHYCTGCETFKTDKEVAEGNGSCPLHPNRPLTWVEEDNYFFRLSAYRERLLAHYAEHPEFIQPESRRNEVISLVDSELRDVAITRKGFTWGIPVPFDPAQTIYVWFDALLNYITGIGYGTDVEKFNRLWPAQVHLLPLRALAGDAPVSRAAPAQSRLRPRVRLSQERGDRRNRKAQQEPGERRRAHGARRQVLIRGIPLLFYEPMSVRRRRRVFVRAVRRCVQQWAGQQSGQSL